MTLRPDSNLAYDVLDQIILHPELWRQRAWGYLVGPDPECGTAGCFAGWTAMLRGHELCDMFGKTAAEQLAAGRGWTEVALNHAKVDGEAEPVNKVARAELGIRSDFVGVRADDDGDDDTWTLFDGENTLDDLIDGVERLFGPRPYGRPVPVPPGE